jgi:2-amino-4-hydroxy-6-hydroxymethyldihydropteridine diphosphokinase
MHRAYLLLGSNIEPERNLPAACRLLAGQGRIERTSQVWESPPADGSAQANYLNAAVLLKTSHSADALRRKVLPEIEVALGRVRDPRDKYAARTIDIDIALFDRDVMEVAGAHIPNPDILKRVFIAVPLAEIDPDYTHPETGRTLADISAACTGNIALRLRSDVRLAEVH